MHAREINFDVMNCLFIRDIERFTYLLYFQSETNQATLVKIDMYPNVLKVCCFAKWRSNKSRNGSIKKNSENGILSWPEFEIWRDQA